MDVRLQLISAKICLIYTKKTDSFVQIKGIISINRIQGQGPQVTEMATELFCSLRNNALRYNLWWSLESVIYLDPISKIWEVLHAGFVILNCLNAGGLI